MYTYMYTTGISLQVVAQRLINLSVRLPFTAVLDAEEEVNINMCVSTYMHVYICLYTYVHLGTKYIIFMYIHIFVSIYV